MSASPAPAWYADPGNPQALRWWDGTQWTAHTHPLPPAAPITAQVAAAAPVATVADPAGVVTQQLPPQYGQTSAGGPPPYNPSYNPSSYTPAPGWAGSGKPRNANHYAFITFGIVALYLFLAFETRVVLIGILPLGMALRSKRLNEPLAYVALGAAILSIIVSLAAFTGH